MLSSGTVLEIAAGVTMPIVASTSLKLVTFLETLNKSPAARSLVSVMAKEIVLA